MQAALQSAMKVAKFPRNHQGRDFVVGDLHGCFDQLELELARIGFDTSADRLFSVGDLVDRGPRCNDVLDWLTKPWFHAVRGNHEQMAMGVAVGKHDPERYRKNGGAWFVELPASRQEAISAAFHELPLAIEVDHQVGRVGVVHADVRFGCWGAFCDAVSAVASANGAHALLDATLWSRARIKTGDTSGLEGVAKLFVGHAPVRYPIAFGNVVFVDTGAVFPGGRLTVLDIADASHVVHAT